jgi:trehalose-phosphatase
MRVETKRLGLTVHCRHMSEADRRTLEVELAGAINQGQSGRFKLFHGSKAVEILPQVGWSKGHCALRIREWARRALPPPMLSVYVGDDWTDDLAFGKLEGQAIIVRVGPPKASSRATYRFNGVEGVHRLLGRLAAATRPLRATFR